MFLLPLLKNTGGNMDGSKQATKNATSSTTTMDSASAKIDLGHGTVGALVNGKQLYSKLTSYRFDLRVGRLLTGSALVIW
jgi:hypothetical protein